MIYMKTHIGKIDGREKDALHRAEEAERRQFQHGESREHSGILRGEHSEKAHFDSLKGALHHRPLSKR
jgi:hypothetical protein